MAKSPKTLGRLPQPSYMPVPKFRESLERLSIISPDDSDYMASRKVESFLHVHQRTVQRWFAEESPIDARTAMLLHVLVKHGISASKAESCLERNP